MVVPLKNLSQETDESYCIRFSMEITLTSSSGVGVAILSSVVFPEHWMWMEGEN